MPHTVLVTGGTGFLGRHLVPALCRAGYHMRVMARNPNAHPWLKRYPDIEVVTGDVLDDAAVRGAANGCHTIVHAAGLFRFWGEQAEFDATNVTGTENVFKAAGDAERVIHISTVAVIGQPDPARVIDETHPAAPADAYQRSKLKAEKLALRYYAEQGTPVIILRPGAFYGPLGHYAFNRLFFSDPMRGIIMQIDGGRYHTFPVYVGDVAQAIVSAITRGRVGEIYNVCGEPLTHKQAFDIVCREGNIRYPRLNVPGWAGVLFARILTAGACVTHREPFYPTSLRSYVYNDWRVSSEKAKRELGFAPIDFCEGAQRTLYWYCAGQPEWITEVEC